MLLDVVKVAPEQGCCLLLDFENGERRRFEMSCLLNEKPFDRLKDTALFQAAYIAHGSVAWPGNIDIAPEMLYDYSSPL